MELPVLDKFCFVYDLKAGCIAMGILNIVINLLLAVVMLMFAMDIRSSGDGGFGSRRFDTDDGISSLVFTIVLMMAGLLVCKIVLDMVFVVAAFKEKRGFLTKYFMYWIAFLVSFSIGFLKTLFHMDAQHVIAQILFLTENFYFIVVIRSYLKYLAEQAVE